MTFCKRYHVQVHLIYFCLVSKVLPFGLTTKSIKIYKCSHCESWKRLPTSSVVVSYFSIVTASTYRLQRIHHSFKRRWVPLSRALRLVFQRLILKSTNRTLAAMLYRWIKVLRCR